MQSKANIYYFGMRNDHSRQAKGASTISHCTKYSYMYQEHRISEMRIQSILLIKSDLKNGVYILVEVSFYISTTWCHCWWTTESSRAHVDKFYGGLRLKKIVCV